MSERSEGYSDGYAAGLRWGKRDGDRIAAETLRELHRVRADRDRLAATVERVEELAGRWEQIGRSGGANHRLMAGWLRAALKGDS